MAMLTISEYLEHPDHRCFSSHAQGREALNKLAEGLQKRTPPQTVKELQPIASSFASAVSRIPIIRGPSSESLNFDTIYSEDDDEIDGDVANDIRSVILVSISFQFLNTFSMCYPMQFVKFASFFVDIWPAMYKWLVFLAEDVLDPVTSPYRNLATAIWPAAAFFLGEVTCIHDTPLALVNLIPMTRGITRWAVRIWTQDIRLGWKQLAQSARSACSVSALLVDFRRHPCEVTPMKTDDEAHAHGVDADEWAELKMQARETNCIQWVAILVAPPGASCYVRGLAPLPTPQAA